MLNELTTAVGLNQSIEPLLLRPDVPEVGLPCGSELIEEQNVAHDTQLREVAGHHDWIPHTQCIHPARYREQSPVHCFRELVGITRVA